MTTYDSNQLLIALKAFSRVNSLPLDASEVWESLTDAQAYARTGKAYAGQTIKALVNGKYESYVIQGTPGAYTLEKVGVDQSELTNYVQIVDSLPVSGQEQGVIYINTADSKGYIWTGTEFKIIFEEIEGGLAAKLTALEGKFADYAPLNNPTFTGTVTLAADPTNDLEAATKQYVDRLISGLNSFTVGIVDSANPLPTEGYTVGQSFRVVEAGTYAGQVCEIGDLIIVINDYAAGAASDNDFLVVQANVSGAILGPDSATSDNLAVFDGITGKKVKDSAISAVDVSDAIAKKHEHANKDVLDTYDKSQADLIAAVGTDVDTKINTAKEGIVQEAKDYTDGEISTLSSTLDTRITSVEQNLNTKVSNDQLREAIGDIPGDTSVATFVKTQNQQTVDIVTNLVKDAGNTAVEDAKEYTDAAMTIIEF